MKITGAIIAGGKSRRMGQDKRLLPIEGTPMILRVLNRVARVTAQQIIIANDESVLRPVIPKIIPIFPDDVPDSGALGGIYTALNQSSTEWIFCAAADMPFINPHLVQKIISLADDAYDVVLPIVDERSQGLHALYRTSAKAKIHTQLMTGNLRIAAVFNQLRVRKINEKTLRQHDPALTSFTNLNAPSDLAQHQSE